jgi:hypothetical protein
MTEIVKTCTLAVVSLRLKSLRVLKVQLNE